VEVLAEEEPAKLVVEGKAPMIVVVQLLLTRAHAMALLLRPLVMEVEAAAVVVVV
jgi:hypothetical protein